MPKFFKRGHVPEHLNVPWGPVQGLIVFALVWLGLPIVLILVAGVLAPYVPIVKSFYDGLVNSDVTANFIETVIDAVAGIALVYYFLRRYKVGWKAVGWRTFKVWKALLYLFVIALAFYVGALVLLTVVSLLIPSFNANQAQNNDFTGSVAQQHRLISILALVIIPPIIEETVFRGFIFPAFAKKWGTWIGAICSSLLFGFAHLQANVSIYTFLLGMLLCYMYVKLKSVYPGMALHMLNNAIALWAISAK
jgi:membrane protease YdiL (CAAX protease family)